MKVLLKKQCGEILAKDKAQNLCSRVPLGFSPTRSVFSLNLVQLNFWGQVQCSDPPSLRTSQELLQSELSCTSHPEQCFELIKVSWKLKLQSRPDGDHWCRCGFSPISPSCSGEMLLSQAQNHLMALIFLKTVSSAKPVCCFQSERSNSLSFPWKEAWKRSYFCVTENSILGSKVFFV